MAVFSPQGLMPMPSSQQDPGPLLAALLSGGGGAPMPQGVPDILTLLLQSRAGGGGSMAGASSPMQINRGDLNRIQAAQPDEPDSDLLRYGHPQRIP